MKALEPPESHHLHAAQGWFELGDDQTAAEELARIAQAFERHPDVLELRWLLAARAEEWDVGVNIGRDLVQTVPDRVAGWLHRAYATRRAAGGGLRAAYEALLPAAERFPEAPMVSYNLACYTCRLGDLRAARVWLNRGLEVADRCGGSERYCFMALNDSDLEPLWPEIRARSSAD